MSIKAHAKSKYIRISPYKLRLFSSLVCGNTVEKALILLKTCSMKRVVPVIKTIFSAYSNARNMNEKENFSVSDFVVKEFRVDQGPTIKYHKPGAMGRSCVQRRRSSHLCVIVEQK